MIRFFTLLGALALTASACAQSLPPPAFVEGTHYTRIETPEATSSTTVEVMEVFSYACAHCAHFEPIISSWHAKMPAGASFSLMPAAWSPQWEVFARAYYAAEVLGIADKSHGAMFKALYEEHRPFGSLDDLGTFYSQFGVKAEDFVKAATSFAVDTKIARSKSLVPRMGVAGTPTVVIAGKYLTDGTIAGSLDNVPNVINFLVAKELSERKLAAK